MFTGLGLLIVLLISVVIIPLLKAFSILKGIDNYGLNRLIVNKYPQIKDLLLNSVELIALLNKKSDPLIHASILQKYGQFEHVDIKKTINFKRIRRMLLFFMLLVCMVTVLFLNIKGYTKAFYRILDYKTEYLPEPPYHINIANDRMMVEKGEDFFLEVEITGNRLPGELFFKIGNSYFMMKREGEQTFSYLLKNVNNSLRFYVSDRTFDSGPYDLQLLVKPFLVNFSLNIKPPRYTGIENYTVHNDGNIDIPVGSTLKWNIKALETDTLKLLTGVDKTLFERKNNIFSVVKKGMKSFDYTFLLSNNHFCELEDILYRIQVIPDLNPSINVVQVCDSTNYTLLYFKGNIEDDYGFSKLLFRIQSDEMDSIIPVSFDKNIALQYYYYAFDFNTLKSVSSRIEYYFEVWDNDAVNGSKRSISQMFTFNFPDRNELISNENERFEAIENMVEKGVDLTREIREKIDRFKQQSVEKNLSDWERSQLLQDVVSGKDELEKMMNNIQQQQNEMNNFLNTFDENEQKLFEKQQQVNELIEEIFSDDIKELMDQFNELLEEFNQKKFNDLSEKIEMSMDDFEKRLDRNLELLRKLQVERKMERMADMLNELAMEEERMGNDKELFDNPALESDIKQHNETFESVTNELKKTEELNNTIKEPFDIPDLSNEEKAIKENFDKMKHEFSQNKKRKLKNSLNENSSKLKDFAFKMRQSISSSAGEKIKVDLASLKNMLADLVELSFEQEDIFTRLSSQIELPENNALLRREKVVSGRFYIIKDSIYALSYRMPQIKNIVNDDLVETTYNLSKGIDEMLEGRSFSSRVNFRKAMTSMNNLALFFEEIIAMLEKQMAGGMPGDQQCEKPGGSGASMPDLKAAQESFKKQLQGMIDELKKNGKSGKLNREIGEALSQQEVLQNMVQKMINQGDVGSEAQQALKQIDKMLEENKKDLLNYRIGNEMINRQNLIFDKLLKAENAEMEREKDDERKSESAKEYRVSNPAEFFENREQQQEQTVPEKGSSIKLKRFYQSKYTGYKKKLEEKND